MLRPLPPALAAKLTGRLRPSGDQWVTACFAGDTRYLTRSGVRTLAETAGTVQPVLVARGTWVDAEIKSFGVQCLYAVHLSRNGVVKTIYATKEHRWFRAIDTRDRLRRNLKELTTADLRPNHRLASAFARRMDVKDSFRPAPIGVAHGFIWGDGSIRANRTNVTIHHAAQGKLDAMVPLLTPMAAHVNYRESEVNLDGFPRRFKSLVDLDEDRAYMWGWLSGYFAADGNVQRGIPTLDSADRSALEHVRDVATILGIGTYGIRAKTRHVVLPTGAETDHIIYSVTFMPNTLTEQFFLLDHHRRSFREVQDRRKRHDSYGWRVISVEETDRVEEVFCAVVPEHGNFTLEDNILTGNCPAHQDDSPSLAIKVGDDGKVAFYDHGGCQTIDILAALKLSWRDVMGDAEEPKKDTGEWTPVQDSAGNYLTATAIYDYHDEIGTLLYQVVRINMPGGKKTFRQRQPDPTKKSGWAWNTRGVRVVIYQLPKVLSAIERGEEVWCYTPDTEVLTPTGWVALPDLPRGVPVAQWDLSSEAISFAEPTAYHQFPYEGDLVHIRGDWCDLSVTPDHRQPRRLDRSNGRLTKPKVVSADELGRAFLPAGGLLAGMGGPDETTARLLVAWLADGVDEQRGFKVSFNLKKDRKKDRLRRLLSHAGVPWTEHIYPSTPGWTNFRIQREHFNAVLELAKEGKRWQWDWLRWGSTTRAAMLDEVGHWDGDFGGPYNGSRDTDSVPDHAPVRLFTAEKQDADVVCAMACTTGMSAMVRRDDRPSRPEQASQFIVSIHRRRVPGDDGPGKWRSISKKPTHLPYAGDVYCLTVPTSFLVVRRNGKVTISGNCVEGEKDVHTAEGLGQTATCNSGGAGKFPPDAAPVFKDGAHVLIVADADEPGRAHARSVKALIEAEGGIVRVAEPKAGFKDLTDHVAAGFGVADLQIIEDVAMPDLGLIWIEDLLAGDVEDYDWLVPGLIERGERFMLTGMEGSGKALELSTKIPTPSGWTTMGELVVEDWVIDRDGQPCRVTGVTETQVREAHRITFSDGATLLACADHQWVTQTWLEREYAKSNLRRDAKRAARVAAGLPAIAPRGKDQSHLRVPTEGTRTTAQIMDTLIARAGTKTPVTNHSIAAVKPLDLPDADLPIDPYLLGVWLGDGNTNDGTLGLGTRDADAILGQIEAGGRSVQSRTPQWKDGIRVACDVVRIEGFKNALRVAGLLGRKHIPPVYLRASAAQRLALLQGLMDTDGYAPEPKDTGRRGAKDGVYEIVVTTKHDPLADGIMELLCGLGVIPNRAKKVPTIDGIEHAPVHRITFQTDLPVFTVPFKADRMRPPKTDRARLRYITKVENTEVLVPMRCISVDSPTRTYLAGEGMIPTHNTVWLRQFATCVAAGIHPFTQAAMEPRKVLWIDAENSRRQNHRFFDPLMNMTIRHHRKIPPEQFGLFIRPEGLDLTKEDDRAWFHERIALMKPDLLVIGPWYRLFTGSPNDEENQRAITVALDLARARHGFAVMIETHTPHSDGFKTNKMGGLRPVRPIGSSILLRWPEFGFGLSFRDSDPDEPGKYGLPDFGYADFLAWRGARDEREWPEAFRRSDDPENWPWLPCEQRPIDKDKHYKSVVKDIERRPAPKTRPTKSSMGREGWGPQPDF